MISLKILRLVSVGVVAFPPNTVLLRASRWMGDSLAVELPTLTRKALVRIQVPQPTGAVSN